MNKLRRIVFVGDYTPGDASSNFVVSFCLGYAQLGLDVILIVTIRRTEDLPSIPGVKVYPILRSAYPVIGGVHREIETYKVIKKFYLPGESIVQYYSSPVYGWLHSKKSYHRVDTLCEVPFANPNVKWSYKVREWLRKIAAKKASGLLVLTGYLKQYFADYGIDTICVFNILINPARFERLKKDTSKKFITYCGSVGLYKDGVNDLITAFKIAHQSHQDISLRIIGGFASTRDEEVLRNKVVELGLSDCVLFTGRVLPEDMPQLLFNSEILALARPDNKQAKYGFPSKLGEYLFTGNPVVITRVGEIDHFLTDKKSCVFAKPGDPEDFADKLNWVLDNPKESREIGEQGKAIAIKNFTIKSQCETAISFFERIINK